MRSMASSSQPNIPLGKFKYHVFLTHNWGAEPDWENHQRVSVVNDGLAKRGLTTWFDENQIKGDTSRTMAKGVEESCVVVVFVTEEYIRKVASDDDYNCKFEFYHARAHRKPTNMIPVLMERVLWPWNGPVGAILGFHLNLDMTDGPTEETITELFNMIVQRIGEEVGPCPSPSSPLSFSAASSALLPTTTTPNPTSAVVDELTSILNNAELGDPERQKIENILREEGFDSAHVILLMTEDHAKQMGIKPGRFLQIVDAAKQVSNSPTATATAPISPEQNHNKPPQPQPQQQPPQPPPQPPQPPQQQAQNISVPQWSKIIQRHNSCLIFSSAFLILLFALMFVSFRGSAVGFKHGSVHLDENNNTIIRWKNNTNAVTNSPAWNPMESPEQAAAVTQVGMHGCGITAEDLPCLFEMLTNCPNIEYINLSDNNFGDEGAAAIATALPPALPKLKYLYLRGNKITAQGAEGLCKALPSLSLLQKLSLSDNNLGDEGVERVLAVLRRMPSLRSVGLAMNGASEQLKKTARNTLSFVEDLYL